MGKLSETGEGTVYLQIYITTILVKGFQSGSHVSRGNGNHLRERRFRVVCVCSVAMLATIVSKESYVSCGAYWLRLHQLDFLNKGIRLID